MSVSPENRPSQTTNRVVMVKPDYFGFNAETATSNSFQKRPDDEVATKDSALREFGTMVNTLRNKGINVTVLPSPKGVITPDAVFPNNWFSTHEKGKEPSSTIVLYPMATPNRQAERQGNALRGSLSAMGLPTEVIDMSGDEAEGKILEGTGSLVLDRANRIAYAIESPRTTKEELDKWSDAMDYDQVFFHAVDSIGNPVYHTNVVMNVGDGFAVLCADAIPDAEERSMVEARLAENGELIKISPEQMDQFAGNILQVVSTDGDPKIIMSQTAHDAFTPDQRERLQQYGELVPVQIPTIENVGGGSARCMIAEVFPPEK